MWWPEVELNHRHTDFQSVALPTELSGPLKESLRGISRSVFASSWSKNGAVGETRTPTPLLKLVPETSTSTNSVTTALL